VRAINPKPWGDAVPKAKHSDNGQTIIIALESLPGAVVQEFHFLIQLQITRGIFCHHRSIALDGRQSKRQVKAL
jgi:hypothetical protein